MWPELPSEHPPSSRLTAPPENSAEDGGKVRKVEQSRGKCLPGQSRHDQVFTVSDMYPRQAVGDILGGIGFQLVCTMDYEWVGISF